MHLDAKAILTAVGDVLAEERAQRFVLESKVLELIDEYGNLVRQPGPIGERGMPGERGLDGAAGAAGVEGPQGLQGAQGPAGERGPPGDPGRDGRDGRPGETGPAGESIKGDQGERGESGPQGERGADAYGGQARGLWKADETYRAMDLVAFNGCEWRALRDDPGPCPGEGIDRGWMLSAKGVRGKPGETGPRGEKGDRGDPGLGFVDFEIAGYEIIFIRSDGTAISRDFRPMIERFFSESAIA